MTDVQAAQGKSGLRVTDVSLTDGQSARWGGALTTPMALAVAGRLAAARPAAIEVLSPSTLRQCVALGEDPWQRTELLRERCPGIPLRAVVNLVTEATRAADIISLEVATLWLKELVRRGVSEVLLIDPMMDIDRLGAMIATARSLGLDPVAALCVTQSVPRSDNEMRKQAKDLAKSGAARVMLRDEGGLLTTDRLSTLLPALRAAVADLPLDLHLRCQTGLGPMLAIEAVRLGVDGLDTVFAPVANGPSLQALGTLLKSLQLLGLGSSGEQRLHAVREADRLLEELADRHGFGRADPWAFDLAPYQHQLPGDVAAVAMRHLTELGLAHRLHAFANECALVRSEIGAPPMLAPFAGPIAEQALLHLQGTSRYAEIRPGVRRAIQQAYGRAVAPIDTGLLMRVGALPNSPRPTLAALRALYPAATDASLVLAQVCGVKPDAQARPKPLEALRYVATTPEDCLLAGLTARAARYRRLRVRGPGVSIELQTAEG